MKLVAVLLCSLSAILASAEEDLPLGQYAERTRTLVISKIREALGSEGVFVRLSGVVTYEANGVCFLQSGDDGIKVLVMGAVPKVGDRVEFEGTPSLEGGQVVFVSRKWKRLGTDSLPAAIRVTSAELADSESPVNGLRVTVEGRAIGVTENGFAMNVDGVPVNVMLARRPGFLDDCDRTHPVLSVIGVAEQVLDQSILLGRAGDVMGVKIDVQGPEDVVLKPDVAYLAARRDRMFVLAAGAFAGVLAVGALAFLVVIVRQRRRLFRTRTIMAERKRMADDIHDTIEQHLVGAGMLLRLNRLTEAQEVLVRAKREIRDIVWGLKNDDMMRLTPTEMLRNLAHEENTKGLYRVDTRLGGLPSSMDAAAMRDLSLIVREALGNAVKHGGAKKIAIASDPLEGGGWQIRISNDGTPFDPDSAPGATEGHFGLEGMKQRARRIGAGIRFERRGRGMVLILEKQTH